MAFDALLEHGGERDRHLSILGEGSARFPEPYASYLKFRTARIEFLRGHLESALRLLRDLRTSWSFGHYDHRESRLFESAALRIMGRPAEALALAETMQHEETPAIRMRAFFHTAAAYQALGQIEKVEPEYRRALALTAPLRAARLRALIFTNLSLAAASSADPTLARAYAREGARKLAKLGDRLMQAKALAFLARHEVAAGAGEAAGTIEHARSIAAKTEDREVLTDLAILDSEHDQQKARVSLRENLWDNESLGVETFASKSRAALARLEAEHTMHLVSANIRRRWSTEKKRARSISPGTKNCA